MEIVLRYTQCDDCGSDVVALKEYQLDDGDRLAPALDIAWDEIRFTSTMQSNVAHRCAGEVGLLVPIHHRARP